MQPWAVSVNVGGPRFQAGMTRWAEQALTSREPAIVFAQVVPSDDWLELWREAGYTVTLGEDRGWRVRSR